MPANDPKAAEQTFPRVMNSLSGCAMFHFVRGSEAMSCISRTCKQDRHTRGGREKREEKEREKERLMKHTRTHAYIHTRTHIHTHAHIEWHRVPLMCFVRSPCTCPFRF